MPRTRSTHAQTLAFMVLGVLIQWNKPLAGKGGAHTIEDGTRFKTDQPQFGATRGRPGDLKSRPRVRGRQIRRSQMLRWEETVEVTEVRVRLADSRSERLRAYATVTLDGCFVVRDLKIISGTSGLFVAMPSRKRAARCRRCRCGNHLRAQFCNECGTKLRPPEAQTDEGGREKLHADIAHPINQACRDMIESSVLREVEREIARSQEAAPEPRHDA